MKRQVFLTTFLTFSLLLLAVGSISAQSDEFVFGMVLVGPQDDKGWSQAHYEGGLFVEEHIENTRMLVFESLNPADAPETTLRDVVDIFVSEGAQLIITTSDAFEEDTTAVAAEFPDVTFINVSGDDALTGEAPANVGNIMAQSEWSRLIAGCAAGLTTQTGQIGYIGPLINVETRREAASAFLGTEYCYNEYNSLAESTPLTFDVTWIGFWFAIPGVTLDPTEESNAFFDRGFDIVMSGIDSTEMVTVAEQRHAEGEAVYSLAYNSRFGCDAGPDSCLGIPYYNWGVAYVDTVQAVMDGTWEQSWDWVRPNFEDMNDLETSITGFEQASGFPADYQASLDEFKANLIAYATDPANAACIYLWQGPLSLQDGTVLAEEGECVTEDDIWYLPQLLEGMTGASE